MIFEDFINYKDKCPLCGNLLILNADFDILTSETKHGNYEMFIAGTIFFDFKNNRFVKSKRINYSDASQKEVINIIHKNLINSFTINKRIYPKVGIYKIQEAIQPIYIDAITLSITKQCYATSDHRYGYSTDSIDDFDHQTDRLLDIDSEFLIAHSKRIINKYHNNIPAKTFISRFSKNYFEGFPDVSRQEFPLIPMSKWNIKTEEDLKNQIQKYSILL